MKSKFEGALILAVAVALFAGSGAWAGESEWTVIFSNDISGWGSFSYDESQDALRVAVQSQESNHEERLAFTFDEVTDSSTILSIRCERLRVPVEITTRASHRKDGTR